MDQKTFNRLRIIRFILWMVTMAVVSGIVGMYAPRKAVFVPCFFLCIMVPTVLLPLEPKAQTSRPGLSRERRLVLSVYVIVMLALVLFWELFTQHAAVWMVLMIASIPIFAALLGGWPERGGTESS